MALTLPPLPHPGLLINQNRLSKKAVMKMNTINLDVALVTGASSGIGLATTKGLR